MRSPPGGVILSPMSEEARRPGRPALVVFGLLFGAPAGAGLYVVLSQELGHARNDWAGAAPLIAIFAAWLTLAGVFVRHGLRGEEGLLPPAAYRALGWICAAMVLLIIGAALFGDASFWDAMKGVASGGSISMWCFQAGARER